MAVGEVVVTGTVTGTGIVVVDVPPSIVVRKVLVLHSVPVELLAVIVEHTEDIEVEVVGARVITCCEREVDTLSVVIVPNWVAVGIVTQDITATGSNKKSES